MKYKIIVAVLLGIVSTKGFSQIIVTNQNNLDTTDKKKYTIIEIAKYRSPGNETTTLLYGNGKTEDISGILYNTQGNKYLTDLNSGAYGENESISEPLKALACVQYMADKNYILISSNATAIGPGPYRGTTYDYQYIFKKKEN